MPLQVTYFIGANYGLEESKQKFLLIYKRIKKGQENRNPVVICKALNGAINRANKCLRGKRNKEMKIQGCMKAVKMEVLNKLIFYEKENGIKQGTIKIAKVYRVR